MKPEHRPKSPWRLARRLLRQACLGHVQRCLQGRPHHLFLGVGAGGHRRLPWSGSLGTDASAVRRVDGDDSGRAGTPATADRLDFLIEGLGLFDGEIAADRVVVELPGSAGGDHVEAGEVAAGCAAITGVGRRCWTGR